MENRIKEQQLYLFADRTSTSWMSSNQLRLCFSVIAYIFFDLIRTFCLQDTEHKKSLIFTIRNKLIKNLSECDLYATSVGQAALPKVVPLIAEGIKLKKRSSQVPLDIIIAENIRNGAEYFRKLFKENGLSGDEAGLIETSIGKMVPIMNKQDLEKDPLVLFAEEYNKLILDKKGFKKSVPKFSERCKRDGDQ